MKCKWCNGTGAECGCGLGYCAHCADGQVAEWPFGITEEELHKQVYDQMKDVFQKHWNGHDMDETIKNVSLEVAGKELTPEDIVVLKEFFNHEHRDTNIGTFCAIVMYRAISVYNSTLA